jgi:hypothetical protein
MLPQLRCTTTGSYYRTSGYDRSEVDPPTVVEITLKDDFAKERHFAISTGSSSIQPATGTHIVRIFGWSVGHLGGESGLQNCLLITDPIRDVSTGAARPDRLEKQSYLLKKEHLVYETIPGVRVDAAAASNTDSHASGIMRLSKGGKTVAETLRDAELVRYVMLSCMQRIGSQCYSAACRYSTSSSASRTIPCNSLYQAIPLAQRLSLHLSWIQW